MPGFTPAASATSRIDRRSQPRRASKSRPAASRAWSRFRDGRGIALLYNCIIIRVAMRSPDLIARIRGLIDAGLWSDAEAAWVSEGGASPLAWRDLGFLCAEHGKHAKAEELLERARSLGEASG